MMALTVQERRAPGTRGSVRPRRRRNDQDVQAHGLRDRDPRPPRPERRDRHGAGSGRALEGAAAHGLEALQGALEGSHNRLPPRAARRLRAGPPRGADLGGGDRGGAGGAHRPHRVRPRRPAGLRPRADLRRKGQLGPGVEGDLRRAPGPPPLRHRPSQGARPARHGAHRLAGSPRVMSTTAEQLKELTERQYQYGFVTEVEEDKLPKGLSEDVIRAISAKKGEPRFMLEWRLAAYRRWTAMQEPEWANVRYPPIDYQDIVYYSAPKPQKKLGSMDEVDPEVKRAFQKLGIPLEEQMRLAGVAVDAVFDSVSVATTYKKKQADLGIIFCSFSEAVREHPALVERYLGSVVPSTDNFFAALNSAVFSDGSFVYVPKGVRCPMELSTYFRINEQNTGQFERTLIIADEGAYVSYLEGCTAPMRDTNQLHAAVVELVALDNAQIKYSTVQNWYPGDKEGKGGIYNFVTKRGRCLGRRSKISWTQVETGSAITWKYPSCILQGDNSVGEFYSVAVVNGRQQADTGTKMIHVGRNSRSTIVSKGISAGHGNGSYRGLVKVLPRAENARNYTQCDSMLIGNKCGAPTFPYIDIQNPTATLEHEASTSKISEDQIFYLKARGLNTENAISMIVNGFCKEVFLNLPTELAVEAQKLLGVSLEGSVGWTGR